MKTLQSIYDKSLFGIRKQETLCTNFVGSCVYKNEFGDKCAVGQLIPDNLYTKEFEGITLRSLPSDGDSRLLLLKSRLSQSGIAVNKTDHMKLMQRLQDAHDNAANMNQWEDKMKTVASEFNLKYTEKEENVQEI